MRRQRAFQYYMSAGLVIGISREREIWMKPSSTDWYNRIVLETFDNDSWLQNFRMRKETFDMICEKLQSVLSPATRTV